MGTDLGVFVSIDGGASWLLENTGFANAPVESLRFTDTLPRRLFAFTHGRGAWSVSTGCPAITVAPGSLPSGTVGTAYSQTVLASGGAAPYGFGVTNGTLPTGTTLSAAGALTGTPTASGTFSFTVRATDANTCPGSQAYSVTVAPSTTTTTVTFRQDHAYRGTAFTATATVTGAGLNQSLPVTYGGNCTNVTAANGCTASATFAGNTNYAPSTGTSSITITRATPTTTAGDRVASSGAASVLLGATITAPTATVNEGTVTFTVRQGVATIGLPTPSSTVTSGAASAAFSIPRHGHRSLHHRRCLQPGVELPGGHRGRWDADADVAVPGDHGDARDPAKRRVVRQLCAGALGRRRNIALHLRPDRGHAARRPDADGRGAGEWHAHRQRDIQPHRDRYRRKWVLRRSRPMRSPSASRRRQRR